MGVDINQIVILLAVAIGSNLLLWAWATESGTIVCPDMNTEYTTENLNYDVGNQSHSIDIGIDDIGSLATGRCDGLPFWVVLIFELPLLAGLFYIARAFVGAT